jgi:U4/U6.U5 tri-snRNP-associated protein 3|eukprot:SAG25_NODE_288_length_10343_cov_3.673858_15_plen_86_part_00
MAQPVIDVASNDGAANDEDAAQIAMMKAMGLPVGFDTTQGKPVSGNEFNEAVRIKQKRVYRQYMNRRGGFNKPLQSVQQGGQREY